MEVFVVSFATSFASFSKSLAAALDGENLSKGFDAFIDLSTISSSRIVPKCPTSPPTKRWITDIIPW